MHPAYELIPSSYFMSLSLSVSLFPVCLKTVLSICFCLLLKAVAALFFGVVELDILAAAPMEMIAAADRS